MLASGRLPGAARRSVVGRFKISRWSQGLCRHPAGAWRVWRIHAMGAGLVDAAGVRHEMAGLLGLVTSFEKRRIHLGYRIAELTATMPGHCSGARLRGYEFHYATITEQPDAPLAKIVDAAGVPVSETGSNRVFERGGRATGRFFHLIAEAS